MTLVCDVCGKSNRRLLATFSQENRAICIKCATVSCESLGHKNCHSYHHTEAYKKWNLENKEISQRRAQRINDINSW